MDATWEGVLAWRMRRQLLDRPTGSDAVSVARRLCGVHAQVASSAELSVCVRQRRPRRNQIQKALAARELVKVWAMRGTLHLLPVTEAAACLALVAAAKWWEKPVWQRNFVTIAQLEAIAEATHTALDGRVLTREELATQIVDATSDKAIAEHLTSGWGAVLKPLAAQGILIHGPSEGSRVTFTRPDTYLPDWPAMADPVDAACAVIPAYLGAYGPATIESFDQWLTRGMNTKTRLRTWFAASAGRGDIVEIDVEGRALYARAQDTDDICSSTDFDDVRLLPAFDPWLLGPGTKDSHVVDAARRPQVSKAAGWIAPVVVWRGRVAGTWETDEQTLEVTWFSEAGRAPKRKLQAEADHIGSIRGEKLSLRVTRD